MSQIPIYNHHGGNDNFLHRSQEEVLEERGKTLEIAEQKYGEATNALWGTSDFYEQRELEPVSHELIQEAVRTRLALLKADNYVNLANGDGETSFGLARSQRVATASALDELADPNQITTKLDFVMIEMRGEALQKADSHAAMIKAGSPPRVIQYIPFIGNKARRLREQDESSAHNVVRWVRERGEAVIEYYENEIQREADDNMGDGNEEIQGFV